MISDDWMKDLCLSRDIYQSVANLQLLAALTSWLSRVL